MRTNSSATTRRREAVGLALGAVAVLIFSFTLPVTRAVVPVFGGWTVGMGRAVVAGILAAVVLAAHPSPVPDRVSLRRLAIVAGGVVFGFPLFISLALVHVPASRGAIVVGILPAATALVATLRHGERPSRMFWSAAAGGLATAVGFAVVTGSRGRPEAADGLLFLAVAAAAVGYAEGGSVSKVLGGWQTISWALVLSLPLTVLATAIAVASHGIVDLDAASLLGFAYLSIFSMFLGFSAWYAGMSRGGVARVSQLQLAQPLLTLVWAALLLGEVIPPISIVAAVLVLAFVVATRRAPVRSTEAEIPSGTARGRSWP